MCANGLRGCAYKRINSECAYGPLGMQRSFLAPTARGFPPWSHRWARAPFRWTSRRTGHWQEHILHVQEKILLSVDPNLLFRIPSIIPFSSVFLLFRFRGYHLSSHKKLSPKNVLSVMCCLSLFSFLLCSASFREIKASLPNDISIILFISLFSSPYISLLFSSPCV